MATRDKLTVFLYLLLRDELPAGVIEKQLKEAEYACVDGGAIISSPYLESLAGQMADRLKRP